MLDALLSLPSIPQRLTINSHAESNNQTPQPSGKFSQYKTAADHSLGVWWKISNDFIECILSRLIFYVYQNVCKSMEAQHFITTLNGNAYKKHIIIYWGMKYLVTISTFLVVM